METLGLSSFADFTTPIMRNFILGGYTMLLSIVGLVGSLASVVLGVVACVRYIKEIIDSRK